MLTRGKCSANATAISTQVKCLRASSSSRPTKSKRPKQTSRVHSVPALNPPEVPHPSELSRELAISAYCAMIKDANVSLDQEISYLRSYTKGDAQKVINNYHQKQYRNPADTLRDVWKELREEMEKRREAVNN